MKERSSARELGENDGDTSFEKYRVDSVAEIYNDWRAKWVKNLGNATDEVKHDFLPNYYKTIGQLYAEQGGPYLLGPKVTYVDFAVYQSINNAMQTGTLPASLPKSPAKFRASFEARPRVAAYISSRAEWATIQFSTDRCQSRCYRAGLMTKVEALTVYVHKGAMQY